jgi:hypothetical protein
MYSHYHKLINVGIDVISVKTDAFTIKATDVEKARDTIDFYDGIGGWRVSKTENINIPSINYEIKRTHMPIRLYLWKVQDQPRKM